MEGTHARLQTERRGALRHHQRHTALADSGGRSYAGRLVDISASGFGMELQGEAPDRDAPVSATVLLDRAVVRLSGHVVHAGRRRIGVRLAHDRALAWSPAGPPESARGPRGRAGQPDQLELNVGELLDLTRTLARAGLSATYSTQEALLAYLHLLPAGPHRDRFALELFRAVMAENYPTHPGVTIRGQVRVRIGAGGGPPPAGCVVLLDGSPVARTGRDGRFVAVGIPAPAVPVEVPLDIRHPDFCLERPASVQLTGATETLASAAITLLPRVPKPVCGPLAARTPSTSGALLC